MFGLTWLCTEFIELIANLRGAYAVRIPREDCTQHGSFDGIRFQRVRRALALADAYLFIAVRRDIADVVPVFDRQQAPVVHDALLILKELIAALQLTLKGVAVVVVMHIIRILQRDNKRARVTENLNELADVLKVATAQTLGFNNKHGTDACRLNAPQQSLHLGA